MGRARSKQGRIEGAAKSEKKGVLLVEDSRAIASVLISRCSEIENVETELAATYAAAERLLSSEPERFALAVLDLNLPDAPNGEIIDLVNGHGIPIVVLTGSFDESLHDEMIARGVADYVVKDGRPGIEYVARTIDRIADRENNKILIVDDSAAFREYLEALLQQHGYITLTACDGVEGLECLNENPDIKLVITDYNMPNMDGLAMVTRMRKVYSHEHLGIIAVSDSTKPRLLARFLKSGASDYLYKPFSVEEFFCRVDQNIDMLRGMYRVREAAYRDHLTRLFNRRYFFEHASKLHEQALAGETTLLTAMIDADHFKSVNDRFGHDVGDQVLKAIAKILCEAVRGNGLAARFGGEEFVCLWTIDEPSSDAERLEAIRAQIAGIGFSYEGEEVPVSVSIGATRKLGRSIDQMINLADDAVYQAKHAGRDRVEIDA